MKHFAIKRTIAAALAVVCAAAYAPAPFGGRGLFGGSSITASAGEPGSSTTGTQIGGTPIEKTAMTDVPYVLWDEGAETYTEYTTGECTPIDSSTEKLESGKWYAVTEDVTVSQRITMEGTSHLIVADGAILTAEKGINVTEGDVLIIYGQSDGTGNIDATGTDDAAGIGGSSGQNGGTVIIHGANIYAAGGMNGAGIGGGNGGNGGVVIIDAGSVWAVGGVFAAGIGGGNSGAGATVAINGGDVTASGGTAAAIGYGFDNSDIGSVSLGDGIGVIAGDEADTAAFAENYTSSHYQHWAKTVRTVLPDGKYVQTAQTEDKCYTRFVFVMPLSEVENKDKAVFTAHLSGKDYKFTSHSYYTSMVSNTVRYTPKSAGSVILTVTVTSSEYVADRMTCDLELIDKN